MNRQGSKENPFGGIEWTHIFGPRTGATANPVTGCEHGCRWEMPDGKVVICYAEVIANKFKHEAYKDGFDKIHFHPEVLKEIEAEQQPTGIFIDSMSDLYGRNVNEDWIHQVHATIRKCPQHFFFTLTKNPVRLPKFSPFPRNQAVGVSMPPTYMFGKKLTREQQFKWFSVGLKKLAECETSVRWVSLEPLSFNPESILAKHREALHWAVIGAGTDGPRCYQPSLWDLKRTMAALEGPADGHQIPIFFKGNLSEELAEQVGGWRQQFPKVQQQLAA